MLASFVGQIVSLKVIVGNCSSLASRFSQIAIASSFSWNSKVEISYQIRGEIDYWLRNIDALNVKSIDRKEPPKLLNIIASDASDSGCGALLNDSCISARLFSETEKVRHSTYRELVAVSLALKSFRDKIRYSTVKVLVDNQSAVRILDVGSMKLDLHEIAMDVFDTCLRNGISLETEWVPRELNEVADAASRVAEF